MRAGASAAALRGVRESVSPPFRVLTREPAPELACRPRVRSQHWALQHPLFEGVEASRVLPLLSGVRPRDYRVGEIVCHPDLRRPGLLLLLYGRLCLFDLTSEGRRVILGYVEPGGVEGLLTLNGLPDHFAEAVAPSQAVSVSRPLLERLTEAEPKVATNLVALASRRLKRLEEQLQRLTLRDPSARLAGQLLALAETFANDEEAETWVGPRLSHEQLADMLGLRRETVTVHLRRLRRLGAVRVLQDRFLLHRPLLLSLRDGTPAATAAAQARS